MLVGAIRKRLNEIISDVAKEFKIETLALEIMPDHLHLFVSTTPTVPIHKLVKAIKERSSRILRKEFKELLRLPSLWTHSYFVSTAGNASSATIKRYIEEQGKT